MDENKFLLERAIRSDVFRLAVKSAFNHIIITTIEGKIIFANSAVERITGYSNNEVIGQTPSLWGKQMSKEFYEEMWDTIKNKKKVFEGELTNKRKNGEIYIAKAVISPILDAGGSLVGFIGTEEDITKAKEADRMKTEFVSITAHQLKTPLTAMKWSIEVLRDKLKESDDSVKDYVIEIANESKELMDLINLTSQQFQKSYEVLKSELETSDKEKSAELLNSLSLRNKELIDIISLTAHQLTTPLEAIKLNVERLQEKLNSPDKKIDEAIGFINSSNSDLMNLISTLLNISRIETGRITINPQKVSINTIIDNLLKLYEKDTSAKKIHIELDNQINEDVYADKDILREVITNLVTNAIKYSFEDSVIRISIYRNDKNETEIRITNSGLGIQENEKENIFKKHFRCKNVVEEHIEGSGLGLYFVKLAVESYGGNIGFSSEVNKETSFFFTIPEGGMPEKTGEIPIS